MSACTFFGHRDCYGLNKEALLEILEKLISNGTDTFYVGHQGEFDRTVLGVLERLQTPYPRIRYSVVLAYLPVQKQEYDPYAHCNMYPEGLELVHPKFAIDYRNRWMIEQSTHCVCYVNRTWGGAWKFACMAKRCGLTVINLGSTEL